MYHLASGPQNLRCPAPPALAVISIAIRPSTSSTLFPYTTLFRSLITCALWIRCSNRQPCLSPAAQHGKSPGRARSEEHTSELQSLRHLVCRLLLEKKKNTARINASNPCSEYMFLDDSACNLASLN